MSRNENAKAQVTSDKSNFTRRCSLLSRYLKEKGSFGNIDIGLVRKPDPDTGLIGNSNPPGKQNAMMHNGEHLKIKTLDFFQNVPKGETSTWSGGKAKDTTKLSEPEQGSSQLTIFFGGQVLVYNEFPANKAKEIMEAAKQAKPVAEINIQTYAIAENNNTDKSNTALPDLNEPNNSGDANEQGQQQSQVVERIARRASLHRFFAKRKDRVVARAPYQVHQNAGYHQYLTKPENVSGQPLEQGQSSRQPDNTIAQTMSKPKSEDMMIKVEEEGQCSKDLELRL